MERADKFLLTRCLFIGPEDPSEEAVWDLEFSGYCELGRFGLHSSHFDSRRVKARGIPWVGPNVRIDSLL